MSTPNVLVLRAPGTNCDAETALAFERAGAKAETLHINRLLEKPALFQQFQVLCIPAGSATATTSVPAESSATRFSTTWPTNWPASSPTAN